MNIYTLIGNKQSEKQAQNVIVLLFITAFGPHVIPSAGLRLEHFFIYGVFFYVIVRIFASQYHLKFNRYVFALLCLLCLTFFWIIIVSIINGGFKKIYGALAGLENFLQPIALILISSYFFSKYNQATLLKLFKTACLTLIFLLCINSIIAATSVFFNTWPILQYFVVGNIGVDAGMYTVSQLAATMGRFSGIFNQPFESGLAYSIGLLCWVYWATSEHKINLFGWISFLLLVVGGALSISKVFIVVGFPLGVLYYFWLSKKRLKFKKRSIVGFFVVVIGLSSLAVAFIDNWSGWSFLIRLFDFQMISDNGFIATYTSGRINSDESGVMNLFAHTWSESPIFGFGVPVESILDNAYVEFFYLGGSVALMLYILMLLLFLYITLTKRKNNKKCGKFLFLLWLLTIIAGIGAPVFTINRTSIFFWIVLTLGILILTRKQENQTLNV